MIQHVSECIWSVCVGTRSERTENVWVHHFSQALKERLFNNSQKLACDYISILYLVTLTNSCIIYKLSLLQSKSMLLFMR